MGSLPPSGVAKFVVVFERRDDGGLRVYSDDVPGFVLSHSDPDAVMEDVKPALEVILSAMAKATVIVEPLAKLRPYLSGVGVISEVPSAALCEKEYVTRLAA